jgi:hypothetical protein
VINNHFDEKIRNHETVQPFYLVWVMLLYALTGCSGIGSSMTHSGGAIATSGGSENADGGATPGGGSSPRGGSSMITRGGTTAIDTIDQATGGVTSCRTAACACDGAARCQPVDLLTVDHAETYTAFESTDEVASRYGFGVYTPAITDHTALVTFLVGTTDPQASDDGGVDGGTNDVTFTPKADGDTFSVSYTFNPYGSSLETRASIGGSFIYWVEGLLDWLSIRRAFVDATSFCGCEGISLDILPTALSVPSGGVSFRMTLTDVVCPENISTHGSDELWWNDAPSGSLKPGSGWKTVQFPFSAFEISSGEGTRQNDRTLSIGCSAAIELSIAYSGSISWGVDGETPPPIPVITGSFLVRNIHTY